jgi:hypothetical protein
MAAAAGAAGGGPGDDRPRAAHRYVIDLEGILKMIDLRALP